MWHSGDGSLSSAHFPFSTSQAAHRSLHSRLVLASSASLRLTLLGRARFLSNQQPRRVWQAWKQMNASHLAAVTVCIISKGGEKKVSLWFLLFRLCDISIFFFRRVHSNSRIIAVLLSSLELRYEESFFLCSRARLLPVHFVGFSLTVTFS